MPPPPRPLRYHTGSVVYTTPFYTVLHSGSAWEASAPFLMLMSGRWEAALNRSLSTGYCYYHHYQYVCVCVYTPPVLTDPLIHSHTAGIDWSSAVNSTLSMLAIAGVGEWSRPGTSLQLVLTGSCGPVVYTTGMMRLVPIRQQSKWS
jgi:hypothetical protein